MITLKMPSKVQLISYPDIGCWVTTILTCIICIDCAAQNGDVRLNDLGVYDTEDGVLEIYLENKWIPVCYKEFNSFAAATACRQMYFSKSLRYLEAQESV